MMNKEEADALMRVTAYLLDEDRLAEYKGSFRHENNDVEMLNDYLLGLDSTGSYPKTEGEQA
jgi:hypothetical protein